jgi:enolase
MVSFSTISGRQILDSRGNPTVEAEVRLDDGSLGLASVPSGASTGTHEALELRDGDPHHYLGKSVYKAVSHIKQWVSPALRNNDPFDQISCDNELVLRDGTANLARFGANTTLSVSLAISRACAQSRKLPYYRYLARLYSQVVSFHQEDLQLLREHWHMPTPMFNVLNGGAHTNWQSTDFQEFMLVPHAATSFAEKLEQGVVIYYHLKDLLKKKGFSTLVGDEGGFAPKVKNDQEALELLVQAIELSGYRLGTQVAIALDPATSELYKNGEYHFRDGTKKSSDQMIDLWQDWLKKYPIISLEDGLAEDDWDGWQALHQALGTKIILVGDDHLATNPERISKAQQLKTCNALLLKINQIGTLTEALTAAHLSRKAGWKVIVSHRSGETEDSSIADLAVGIGADYVKMGAPTRGERTAKYNQLLRISEAVENSSKY